MQMENMSPEEQKSLSQLYMFLVQNPKHGAVLAISCWPLGVVGHCYSLF